MKLISCGKFDKKFLIYFVCYIIAALLNTFFLALILMRQEHNSKNVPLNVSIVYSFNIFFGIFDFIDRRKSQNLSKKNENLGNNNIIIQNIKLKYYQYKEIRFKLVFIISIFCAFFYIYNFFRYYITLIYSDKSDIIFNENHNAVVMAIFILLFKFIQKEIFYKHQYLSIIIITVLGIINYILNIILGDTRTDYSTKEIILINIINLL